MSLSWISDGQTKIVAIVGICKNAGKTTVLNAILRQHPYCRGVLSTGRDGETEDLLYKTPKPRVLLPMGTLFCCDTKSLNAQGARVSVLQKSKWHSGGQALWLAKSEQAVETEITGPATAEAQLACAHQLRALGARQVLIDGSLDRKSIVLSGGCDAIILVAGASFGTMDAIVSEISRLLSLSEIGQYPANLLEADVTKIQTFTHNKWQVSQLHSLFGNEQKLHELLDASPQAIYIPGAYSSAIHARLGKRLSGLKLIVRHPECIKLPEGELVAFLQTHQVQSLIHFKIMGIALNSKGVGAPDLDADQLKQSLSTRYPKLDIFDLMELIHGAR